MARRASSSRILFDLGLALSVGADIENSLSRFGKRRFGVRGTAPVNRAIQVNLAPVVLDERDPRPKIQLRGSGQSRLPVERVIADFERDPAWPQVAQSPQLDSQQN